MKQATYEGATITALGHAGFVVEYLDKKLSFAFDPYDLKEDMPVDYIFISHPHFDHCDPTSIRRMLKSTTKIIAPQCCAKELEPFSDQVQLITDKEKHQEKALIYWTVPAYNIDKFRTPNEVFHPKELGGVGFIVEVDRARFYHAGDTDHIPEMDELKKITVAFLPISGTFVMTVEEAIEAAKAFEPKLVIPMHYGKLLGSPAEANRFSQQLTETIPVKVLSTDSF